MVSMQKQVQNRVLGRFWLRSECLSKHVAVSFTRVEDAVLTRVWSRVADPLSRRVWLVEIEWNLLQAGRLEEK